MDKMKNGQGFTDYEGIEAGDFEAFRGVVAELRGEHGCPWDKEQTFESLKPCMVNEMTEALAGIDLYGETGDPSNLCEELGDILLQVVLLAQIAKEEGLFSIEDVVRGIGKKMIRRHPHVFTDEPGTVLAKEVPGRWEEIKKAEKKKRTPQQEKKEKEAFRKAAGWAVKHLEDKAQGKP